MEPLFENSFGNIPQAPIITGSGSAILAPNQSKKSRKWLVFLVIAVLFGTTAFVIAYFTKQLPNSKSPSLERFNHYANYILYGTDSADYKKWEGSAAEQSYMESQLSDIETAKKYFEQANLLWEKTDKTLNGNDDKLLAAYNQQRNLYELVSAEYSRETLQYRDIINLFVQNGVALSKERIANHYSIDENTENAYLSEFQEIFVLRGNAIIDHAQLYAAIGCLNPYEDYVCFREKATTEQIAAADELMEEYRSSNQSFTNYFSAYKSFIISLVQVNDLLNEHKEAM